MYTLNGTLILDPWVEGILNCQPFCSLVSEPKFGWHIQMDHNFWTSFGSLWKWLQGQFKSILPNLVTGLTSPYTKSAELCQELWLVDVGESALLTRKWGSFGNVSTSHRFSFRSPKCPAIFPRSVHAWPSGTQINISTAWTWRKSSPSSATISTPEIEGLLNKWDERLW